MGARALNWINPACRETIVTPLPLVLFYTRVLLGIVPTLVLSTVSLKFLDELLQYLLF